MLLSVVWSSGWGIFLIAVMVALLAILIGSILGVVRSRAAANRYRGEGDLHSDAIYIRRSRWLSLGAFVTLLVLGFILFWALTWDSSAKTRTAFVPTATAVPATSGVDVGCDKGSGEWVLDETLHGQDGKVLNTGMQVGNEDVLKAAKHDPVVLRTYLIEQLAGKTFKDRSDQGQATSLEQVKADLDKVVASKDQLQCVELRKQVYGILQGVLVAATPSTVTAGQVAAEQGVPVENGIVRVNNTYMDSNGNVQVAASNVPANEVIFRNTYPNGAKVDHRSFCANQIIPGPVPAPGKGGLIVIKTDDHNQPVQGFRIILDGSVHQEAVTDNTGVVRFNDLPPGEYTVTEVQQSGWAVVSPDNGLITVTIVVDRTETRWFVNRREVTPTATNTPPPGSTPPPSATNTPVPPTATPVTPTATRVATQTAAATPKPCNCTPVPPDRPTVVPTPRNTEVVPTKTTRPTNTPATDPQKSQTPVIH